MHDVVVQHVCKLDLGQRCGPDEFVCAFRGSNPLRFDDYVLVIFL